jgi:hypothetical protein
MENQQIDLNKLSLTELKALAYDVLGQLQGFQRSLDAVNSKIKELSDKASAEQAPASVTPIVQTPSPVQA